MYRLLLFLILGFIGCKEINKPVSTSFQAKNGGWYETVDFGEQFELFDENTFHRPLYLDTTTFVSFKYFESISIGNNPYGDGETLVMRLDEEGSKLFHQMCKRNEKILKKPVCFVVKDKIVNAVHIQSSIEDGKIELVINPNAKAFIVSYLEIED